MPVSRHQPHPSGWVSRRRLVVTAGAVPLGWLAAGCTLSGPGRDQPKAPQPQAPDPDVAVLRSATVQVTALVQLCEQVVDERPQLAQQVQPMLQVHRRHAEVLGSASSGRTSSGRTSSGRTSSGRTSSGRTSSASTPTGGATAEPLPRGRVAVLSLLAAAEQRAAQAHRRQVRQAESGRFAQLLASISAAESQLAVVLEEAVR